MNVDDLKQRAHVLLEALPYIRELHGATLVVKYGGAAMVEEELKQSVLGDLALLHYVGMHLVLVHGGGKEISALMQRLGKQPRLVEGRRVTDEETMVLTEMVLSGSVNKELVAGLNQRGVKAVGISGRDANLLQARKFVSDSSPNVDYGRVGIIEKVEPALLEVLTQGGYVPVISPVSVDSNGESLNVNADDAASALAVALQAEKLILLSDVPGVLADPGDPDSLLPVVKTDELDELIAKGIISGGMVPKLTALKLAIESGVKKVHMLDGRLPHSILMEIFTDKGIGTLLVAPDAEEG